MQGLKADLLRGCWYLAMPSSELPVAGMVAKTLLGEPVLFGRANDGTVFAIRDACPHRGIPLRHGSFDGEAVQCCYHGWRFDRTGTCVEIPSLREDQQIDLSKVRCGSYDVTERQGVVWIYMPEAGESPAAGDMPEPPDMPGFSPDDRPKVAIRLPFLCSTDHAAFGLMDPTHAAYVHTSWWFKRGARKLRPKEKAFEPQGQGFRMVRHRIPPQNIAYRLFGKDVETEIAYHLPGYRVETIEGSRHRAVGLTAITPVTDETTEVHQMFWVSAAWIRPLAPLFSYLTTVFLDQDRRVVVQQREGLEQGNKTMLVNDADTQARWWMRLKSEWQEAHAAGRGFRNPLKPQVLRWRS